MRNDANVMTKSEKEKIVKANKDFTVRAEQQQLKGKDEAFFVESFKYNIEGNQLYLDAYEENYNTIVYIHRTEDKHSIVEGEVYYSNAYYRSLNLNDEVSHAKVDWQYPHTLRISKPKMLQRTYYVVTNSTPLFTFNPGYFKGQPRGNDYSSYLDGYTIINLKVPKQVRIKDPQQIVWKAE